MILAKQELITTLDHNTHPQNRTTVKNPMSELCFKNHKSQREKKPN